MTTFDKASASGRGPSRFFSWTRSHRMVCILCGILAALLTVFVLWRLPGQTAQAGGKDYIKFATLAPEGSSWMKQMHNLEKEVKQATGGELGFKFYPGGVSGDEKDVIRKMRIGQLHAAGFTGVGLGEILPEVRVLDLPFLFRNDREIAHVYDKMTGYFSKAFEAKGFVLLGWVPVGWIHFFSVKEIRSVEDLRQTKAWMWEGDPLVQTAYDVLGVTPHPLSVTDVLMALQTGMVETVYSSPMGALALQWYTKVNYMSQVRMGNSTGAVLMTRRKFRKLSARHQEILRRASKKYLSMLVRQIRSDNQRAIEVMQKNGLKLAAPPSAQELEQFHKLGAVIRKRLSGRLFPPSLLKQVMAHLQELR